LKDCRKVKEWSELLHRKVKNKAVPVRKFPRGTEKKTSERNEEREKNVPDTTNEGKREMELGGQAGVTMFDEGRGGTADRQRGKEDFYLLRGGKVCTERAIRREDVRMEKVRTKRWREKRGETSTGKNTPP